MTAGYTPPWKLRCPWCDWYAIVNARGMRNGGGGAGVEAALVAERHAKEMHGRTWREFLAARQDSGERA